MEEFKLSRIQVDVSEECKEFLKKQKKIQGKTIGRIIEDALENEYFFTKGK